MEGGHPRRVGKVRWVWESDADGEEEDRWGDDDHSLDTGLQRPRYQATCS